MRPIRLRWLIALVPTLLLLGCGSHRVPQQVLAEQCAKVGGANESRVRVVSPDAGYLLIRLQERGITLTATVDANAQSAAQSPVERLGSIRFLVHTQPGQPHVVAVRADDSPDISGEFCLSAYLVAESDRTSWSAEEAFAAAGRATHSGEWDAAFAQYLSASRRFDQLRERRGAAESRQAMAEIAYLRFDNKRDSYALTGEALADWGDAAEPFTKGALLALRSKALLDIPGMDATSIAPQVNELQAAARRYFQADPAGARELPRLDIMTGFFVYRFSEFERARRLFSTAAAQCRASSDWACYAIASQDVALLDYEGKNYAQALQAFSNALESLPPGLDPKLAADIWNNYGTVQGVMGFLSGSQRSLAAAMRGYAQLGDCQGVRRNLARLGNLMVQLGSLSDAKSYLQQAAAFDCATVLATATLQTAAETSSAARESYTRSERNVDWCARSIDPTELAYENKLIVFNSLVSLGDALMLEGNWKAARSCFDAAGPYATTAQTRMRLADSHGEVLLETKDAHGAHAAFGRAVQIADAANISPAYEFRGLAQLGLVKSALLAGDSRAAVRDGLSALQASIGRGDIDQTVVSLRLLAGGLRGSNQRAQAVRMLQTATDLIEAVPINGLDGEKRATYLATQHAVFAELTDSYASGAGADPEMASLAFMTSERGRARSLRYAVTQSERDAAAETAPAARYQQLMQEVVKIGTSHGSTSQDSLIDALDAAALRERQAEELVDQHQVASTLKQLNADLIEYAIGTGDMFAFVVNDSGLHVIRLGDSQKIALAATDLHDRLLDPESPEADIRTAARGLAELVLWPITAQLTSKRLIFVPDEGLHTVPFNLLPWSNEPSAQLVVQRAEVSIAPSALFLTRPRTNNSTHSGAPRIALLGDPVFRISDWHRECTDAFTGQTNARVARAAVDWTESLPRLPGSRSEVQMVARLGQQSRPASHIETLLGCAAVPSALRRVANGNVDLLHIATHALVDSQRPRLSALALTPEQRGQMTASVFGLLDILGLKLNSRLVVLSACETSRGRLLPGEGVLGPAQAFLQAGADAVIASYWRVDDASTSKFMQQFYKYLLAERLPAATALRRAQTEAAESGASHDWAAFALYGWPDRTI